MMNASYSLLQASSPTVFYMEPVPVYPKCITGYVENQGALGYWHPPTNRYVTRIVPSTQFLSYCISHEDRVYGIDENYGAKGSSLYEFRRQDTDDIIVSNKVSDQNVKGAVFLLKTDKFFYIPGFGSDNLWIVDALTFHSFTVVPTGPRPHGIYLHLDTFYVPCRGEVEKDNADLIYRYQKDDLSIVLPPVDLSRIQSDMGPRHVLFMGHVMYVVTEFACEVLKLDLDEDARLLKRVRMTSPITPDTTGAEIRYHQNAIYTTLRIKDQSGYLIHYDEDLNERGRLKVGRNPRFFHLDASDVFAIVLNQEDQSFTIIHLQQWKIVSTVTDLNLSPQCFVP